MSFKIRRRALTASEMGEKLGVSPERVAELEVFALSTATKTNTDGQPLKTASATRNTVAEKVVKGATRKSKLTAKSLSRPVKAKE